MISDQDRHALRWKLVMHDLFFATHCHTCGGAMNISENYCGESCCKMCWKVGGRGGCRYGGMEAGCLHCLADWNNTHRPSLANPRHMRDFYGLDPMGNGRRFLTKGYLLQFFAGI